jgi:signal peptidase II
MPYFGILTLIIVIDQVSKFWIVNRLELYQDEVVIPGFMNLTYLTNSGAAFSLLADLDSPWRHYFFLCIGAVALVGLTLMWYRQRKNRLLYGIALALIAGGAAGNMLDRLRAGVVVDFIDIYIGAYHWPAFNVADSVICIGVTLFLIITIQEERNNLKKRGE